MTIRRLKNALCEHKSNGIIEMVFFPKMTLSIQDLVGADINEASCFDSVSPVLYDLSLVDDISKECKKGFSDIMDSLPGPAFAFVADSATNYIEISNMISKRELEKPVRLFAEDEEAEEWLKQYVII